MTEHFIPPHGGYPHRLSCPKAEIVDDATVHCCARFLDKRERRVRACRAGRARHGDS